jgi:hypothetical protein
MVHMLYAHANEVDLERENYVTGGNRSDEGRGT